MGDSQRSRAALRHLSEPNQNAYSKRFTRTYRNEVLCASIFKAVEQVQHISEEWQLDGNQRPPT